MPSKDILSIEEFKLSSQQQENQLYERVYALPQFLTNNLAHDHRIVKLFTGDYAVLKAFYFNYMKLAIQSQNSEEYIQILKEMFISFDNIEQGQLQDKFLSDFQYRKFLKDFIETAKSASASDFQATANKYPIIDKILQKLFKTIVPISLFLSEDQNKQVSDFQIVTQIINYLCEQFQEEFSIEVPQKCIKFEALEIFLYVQSLTQIYLTYIDQFVEQKQKINKFQQSAQSNFQCGQGNSFTSKFQQKRSAKNTKHPFIKMQLPSKESKQNYQNSTLSKLQNILKISQNKVIQQEKVLEDERISSLLASKGSLIRRRSRNSKIIECDSQKTTFQQPRSCFQYEQEEEASLQKQNKNYSPINSLETDEQKANTLINILDSRVSEFDQINQIALPSKVLQKAPQKSYMIMRRRQNKDDNSNQINIVFENLSAQNLKSLIKESQQLDKQQLKSLFFEKSIDLPQPSQKNSNQQYKNMKSSGTVKTNMFEMEEIVQLGQDQDSQNTIQDLCQVQYRQSSHQQRTVNLSDNLTYKLIIQRVESRNIDVSRTSIGKSLSSPNRTQKISFFDQENDQKQNCFDQFNYLQKSRINRSQKEQSGISQRSQTKSQNINFEQYMKNMKERLPFKQKSHNSDQLHISSNQKIVKNQIQAKQKQTKQIDFNRSKNVKFTQNYNIYSRQKSSNDENTIKQISFFDVSGGDQFTRSDILLLLDSEFRDKIRAIKNQYKSTIKEGYKSYLSSEIKTLLDQQYGQSSYQHKSILRQENKNLVQQKQQYQNLQKKEQKSRHPCLNVQVYKDKSNRSRQTSIHIQ